MNMTTEERLDAIDKRIDHVMKRLDALSEHVTENTRLINAIDAERSDELLEKLRKENPGMFKVELTQAELDAIVNLYPQGDETECMSGNEVPDAMFLDALLDVAEKISTNNPIKGKCPVCASDLCVSHSIQEDFHGWSIVCANHNLTCNYEMRSKDIKKPKAGSKKEMIEQWNDFIAKYGRSKEWKEV